MLFADDTAIAAKSWSKKQATLYIERHIKLLLKFFDKWKLKMNSTKTEFVIYSKKREREKVPRLVVGIDKIVPKTEATYLGTILDSKLIFTKHTAKAAGKAYGVLQALNCLMHKKSKLSIKNKKVLYKATVKPVMLYAAPIWSNMFASNYYKLQIVQNRCLRKICDASPKISNQNIHLKLHMEEIKNDIIRLTHNFYKNQIQHLTELDHIAKYNDDNAPFKIKHKLPHQILLSKKGDPAISKTLQVQ